MEEKTCTKCHEEWPSDTEFFRPQPRPGSPDRLAPWCRACESDYARDKRDASRSLASNFARATGSAA